MGISRWTKAALASATMVLSVGVAVAPGAGAEPVAPRPGAGSSVTIALNTPFTSDGISYTILSAKTTPDVDDFVLLDFEIKLATDTYMNFWDDTFRLKAGTDAYAPVSDLSELVDADTTATGTVSFLIPDTTTAATLVIEFPDASKEVPLTITAATTSQTGTEGGVGVTVPLNTPYSSGEVTYTILSAVATPAVDDMVRLDLEIKVATGEYMNFWDDTFRLDAGQQSYAPVSDLNELVDADTTATGTISFEVSDLVTDATLVITFDAGDKSVPVTFA